MDYLKNAEAEAVDGGRLMFIRCDKNGKELSREALAKMNFTNSTIDQLVTQTAQRLAAQPEGESSHGLISG